MKSLHSNDLRTLKELAREVLDLQDKVGASGIFPSISEVVRIWARSIKRLEELLPNFATSMINKHPINTLYASLVIDLNHGKNVNLVQQYKELYKLAYPDLLKS